MTLDQTSITPDRLALQEDEIISETTSTRIAMNDELGTTVTSTEIALSRHGVIDMVRQHTEIARHREPVKQIQKLSQ